jgi:hypothetical protein
MEPLVGVSDYEAESIAIQRYERRLLQTEADRALLNQACRLSRFDPNGSDGRISATQRAERRGGSSSRAYCSVPF